MRKRLSYIGRPKTASNDVYARTMLRGFKEGAEGIPEMFYNWCLYDSTLPDAVNLYFDIRPILERFGQAQELDEAFGKIRPEYFKDMPYDPKFGFYTIVPDSEDIIQIGAPVMRANENTAKPTAIPKFCQPICWRFGFPTDLYVPPYSTWWSETVLADNPRLRDVKVEIID